MSVMRPKREREGGNRGEGGGRGKRKQKAARTSEQRVGGAAFL